MTKTLREDLISKEGIEGKIYISSVKPNTLYKPTGLYSEQKRSDGRPKSVVENCAMLQRVCYNFIGILTGRDSVKLALCLNDERVNGSFNPRQSQ